MFYIVKSKLVKHNAVQKGKASSPHNDRFAADRKQSGCLSTLETISGNKTTSTASPWVRRHRWKWFDDWSSRRIIQQWLLLKTYYDARLSFWLSSAKFASQLTNSTISSFKSFTSSLKTPTWQHYASLKRLSYAITSFKNESDIRNRAAIPRDEFKSCWSKNISSSSAT